MTMPLRWLITLKLAKSFCTVESARALSTHFLFIRALFDDLSLLIYTQSVSYISVPLGCVSKELLNCLVVFVPTRLMTPQLIRVRGLFFFFNEHVSQ